MPSPDNHHLYPPDPSQADMKLLVPLLAALATLASAQAGPAVSVAGCYPGTYVCDSDGSSWWVCGGDSRWQVSRSAPFSPAS